jgi:hypothetical protein
MTFHEMHIHRDSVGPVESGAPDTQPEILTKTNRAGLKRKRAQDTEGLAGPVLPSCGRSHQAGVERGPVAVATTSTVNQGQKADENNKAGGTEVLASAGGASNAPAPPQEAKLRVVKKMTARMSTGGKPPKRPVPAPVPAPALFPPPPSTPSKKDTARKTTRGKPPKCRPTPTPPSPSLKKRRFHVG